MRQASLPELIVTTAMLSLEALVVVHWYLLPRHPLLLAVALGAGAVMSLMAAADLLLLGGVLRRDVRDGQQRVELADLAHVEPLWACVTVVQIAFIAAAYGAGVYWIAVVLTCGQGAELIAVAVARARIKAFAGPASPAAG